MNHLGRVYSLKQLLNQPLTKLYAEQRRSYQGKTLLFHTIAYHAAPVLENLKPAVLLVFNAGKLNLAALWRSYRRELTWQAPLEFFQLKTSSRSIVVLFYRRDAISVILKDPHHETFLKEFGYEPHNTVQKNLSLLRKSFKRGICHEIGLFLGIPLQDVLCFMRERGCSPIFIGCWKVYHKPEYALSVFYHFKAAKKKYLESLQSGQGPEAYLAQFRYSDDRVKI